MNRFLSRAFIASLMATLVLAVSSLPAAALTIKGQGSYSSFSWGLENPTKGVIAIVDKTQGNTSRLSVAAVGLMASHEYFVIGRSIDCNGTPSSTNRSFRVRLMSNANGDIFVTQVVSLKNVTISSYWISPTDGSEPAHCGISHNFETLNVATGDVNGDGALGVTGRELGHAWGVVEKRPHHWARVSVIFDGGSGSDTFKVIGSARPCGQTSPSSQNFFSIRFGSLNPPMGFEDVHVGKYRVKTIDMSQNRIDGLRSLRTRNVTQGKEVGCGPLSIIAVLIGL